MEELENFSTWCDIVGSVSSEQLEKDIENSYACLREHCHSGKWHPMNVTVSTVVKDEEVVHILTAQLVKVEYLQQQQLRSRLQGNHQAH